MPMELDPEVKSQLDVLKKAREGLKAAQGMVEQAEAILKLFPEDKTAARAKMEADRMVERFTKHTEAAGKIIRTLSKKTLPPALKREADVAVKAIKARLVDPETLVVIPWQGQSIMRGGGVQYQMVFRLKGAPAHWDQWLLTEDTGSANAKIESWQNGRLNTNANGKSFAEDMLEALRGWPGIKGEDQATAAREGTAQNIANVLNYTIGAMSSHSTERAKITNSNMHIEASYRSSLPKEGAYSVGEYEYEEMVKSEIAACRRVLDPRLAPYKDKIKDVSVYAEEKSWVYISVTLK